MHRLGLRCQDDEGDWSVAFTRTINRIVAPAPMTVPLIDRIEYRWLVEEIAVGNTVALAPGTPAQSFAVEEIASLAGLQEGQTAILRAVPFDTLGNEGIPAFATVEIETEDSDGDGVPDQWELTYGFNPDDINDMALNSDGDDLTNQEEFQHGTDPLLEDTDGDELSDSGELLLAAFGFDPTVDNSSLRDSLFAAAVGAGLYSEQRVRNLRLGDPVIGRDAATGKLFLRLRVDQTSGLRESDWLQLSLDPGNLDADGGDITIDVPDDTGDTQFFRVQAFEPPP
jgi:hypothetical protein